MGLVIAVDFQKVLSKNKKLQSLTKKAIVSALNVVGKRANVAASAQIRTEYNVKKQDISKAVKLIRASGRRLVFKIFVRSGRMGLMRYGARETKKGLTVQIKKTEGRKLIPHSFKGPWRKGESGQWAFLRDPTLPRVHRTGRSKDKALYTRTSEARRALFGPSVTQLYASKRVGKKIRQVVDDNLAKALNHDLKVRAQGIVK